MENEIWKDCPEFEETHEVSNEGRVRSKDRMSKNSRGSGYRLWKGKILVLSPTKTVDYLYVKIWANNKRQQRSVHRLVAMAFIPNTDDSKNEVNHLDLNKLNNKVENLQWVSPSENKRHAHANGAHDHVNYDWVRKPKSKETREKMSQAAYKRWNKGE